MMHKKVSLDVSSSKKNNEPKIYQIALDINDDTYPHENREHLHSSGAYNNS